MFASSTLVLEKDTGLLVCGQVVSLQNNIALSGLAVELYAISSSGRKKKTARSASAARPKEHVLGSATTDSDGRFQTAIGASARDHGAVPALLHLVVKNPATRKTYSSLRLEAAETIRPLRLELALPSRPITAAHWRDLGRRMETSRIVRLHEVARALSSSDNVSLGTWDFELRQSMLLQLEMEFLDPSGRLRERGIEPTFHSLRMPGALDQVARKLRAAIRKKEVARAFQILQTKVQGFESLFLVDWVIDPVEFKKGKPGDGVNKFQDLYNNQVLAPDSDALGKLLDHLLHQASDRSRYRDYLRTLYTDSPQSSSYSTRLQKLESRFHQDMETFDDDDQPANAVLIPILKQILQAPKGQGYGFGIVSSSIKSQGNQTNREYLDYLIGLSGQSSDELHARYRLNFSRDDAAISSRVRENIAALQGFYADGFQSPEDPYPLYNAKLHGKAPFFLGYEEWLLVNGPFYGENHYQIKETFRSNIEPAIRSGWEKDPDAAKKNPGLEDTVKLLIDIALIEKQVSKGYAHYSQAEFQIARNAYAEAEVLAEGSLKLALQEDKVSLSGYHVIKHLAGTLQTLSSLPIKGIKDVAAFTDAWIASYYGNITKGTDTEGKWWEWIGGTERSIWLAKARPILEAGLLHFLVFVLPVLRGDLELAAGDYVAAIAEYEKTTRFLMARADLLDGEGYDPESTYKYPTLISTLDSGYDYPRLYHTDGQLPYTTPRQSNVSAYQDYVNEVGYQGPGWIAEAAALWAKDYLHAMEKRFLRLRHGIALLEWADALYRADNPSDIARARELYKAVLWLHSETPAMVPHWEFTLIWFVNQNENPALASQKVRARLGFAQIEAGLNYYGLSDRYVPSLRYQPLKDAADRYAATAKSAQQDFLLYMEKLEDALRDGLIQTSMLKKAQLQSQIAEEQIKLAQSAAQFAKHQIDQVLKAIQAKKDEIADHDGFFNQFTSFVGGMKNAIADLPDFATNFGAQGTQSAAGVNWTGDVALTGAAAGAGAMAGYGIFMYAGYTSLSAIADASNALKNQLDLLQNDVLPLAKAQYEDRKREIKIAQLNNQIAQADAALARSLLQFQSARFLNTEFWAYLAGVMRRVMQRFLTLGARFGWLAERALSYEQNRPINIIRFDYFPKKLQGVTGADLLQLDLGELEAARLEGIRQTIPIRRTVSLAFEYPVEFARLKAEGVCSFLTQELPLRLAYPGIYGYRIRAASLKVAGLSPLIPIRGILINRGASLISRLDGTTGLSLRPQEALPLSEFQWERDMAVYGLPGETFMIFEGSGIETLWSLDLPAAANPHGLADIADIQITFDLQAHYSTDLALKDAAALPKSTQRYVFLSARVLNAQALDDFRENGSALFEFDTGKMPLPVKEKNRVLTNALLFIAQKTSQPVKATVQTASLNTSITVTLEQNAAISNAPPFKTSASIPASPLNGLAGQPFDQVFSVQLQKTGTADFSSATDVVLGLEYKADL